MKKKLSVTLFSFFCFLLLNAQIDSTKNIEVMATFPGGEAEMFKFLDKNLVYPPTALKQGIQGKVWIGFLVSKEGKISDVVVLRGIGGGCDEEAKRVVEAMPNWIPGTLNGQPVEIKFRFPINFILQDDSKKDKKHKKHD